MKAQPPPGPAQTWKTPSQANKGVGKQGKYQFLLTEVPTWSGEAPDFEAKQAKQSEYSSKLSYVETTNSYRNSLDDFKQKLSLPLGTKVKLEFKVLDDLEQMGLPEVPVEELSGYRLALARRLDLMNVIDRFEFSLTFEGHRHRAEAYRYFALIGVLINRFDQGRSGHTGRDTFDVAQQPPGLVRRQRYGERIAKFQRLFPFPF